MPAASGILKIYKILIKDSRATATYDFNWFLALDFNNNKAYDLRYTKCLDWEELSKIFPTLAINNHQQKERT